MGPVQGRRECEDVRRQMVQIVNVRRSVLILHIG